MKKIYDVFGIGNALMDYIVEVDDAFLKPLKLEKGKMHLIDERTSKDLHEQIKKMHPKIAPGGSCANALAGVACMGGSVVFYGSVGNDMIGDLYLNGFNKGYANGKAKANLCRAKEFTGNAITFITPDAERTFAVCLGASIKVNKFDLNESDIAKSRILHIEAYQLEDPILREVILHAIALGRKYQILVSLDLSDASLINRNLEDFKHFVNTHVDILFANEKEAAAFTGEENEQKAFKELCRCADVVALKVGERGSYLKVKDEKFTVKPHKVNAIDTNGAGDMYAAGILYGLTHNLPAEQTGKLASYASSKIVQQRGARYDGDLSREIRNL